MWQPTQDAFVGMHATGCSKLHQGTDFPFINDVESVFLCILEQLAVFDSTDIINNPQYRAWVQVRSLLLGSVLW